MASTASPDTKVAQVAGGQLGLITMEQLRAAGLSRGLIRVRVDRGSLVKVGVRTFAVGGVPRSWEQAALAACLDLGEDAVTSYRSAAAAWSLLGEGFPIEVSVPCGKSARYQVADVVIHRTHSLTSADRAIVGLVRVTTPSRTLVDLAGLLEPDELASCLHDALCRRLVSPDRLMRKVDQLSRRGRKGTQLLRELLRPWLDHGVPDSVAEGTVLRALVTAGLPAPVSQYKVVEAKKVVAILDFAWPEHHVALEVDGFRWHANPASHANDAVRASRLETLGWSVHRTTPVAFRRRPDLVVEALRTHLSAGHDTGVIAGAG